MPMYRVVMMESTMMLARIIDVGAATETDARKKAREACSLCFTVESIKEIAPKGPDVSK